MKTIISTALLLTGLATGMAQTKNTLIMKPDARCGKDAIIRTNTVASLNWQTTNSGNSPEMAAIAWTWYGSGGGPGTFRSLIDFRDLSLIPTGATIVSATLRLYGLPSSSGFSPANSGSNGCWVQRVTGSWNENTVTWNTQPAATTTNQALVPASTATWGHNATVNVAALVQDMVNLPASNRNGFLIRLQTEATYRSLVFASSDNSDPALWPELEVVYTYSCNQALPRQPIADNTSKADVLDNAKALEIFPNPADGLVNVNFTVGEVTEGMVQVTNSSGQTVKRMNVSTVQGLNRRLVDVSDLPAGNYVIDIRFNNPAIEPMTQKLVVGK